MRLFRRIKDPVDGIANVVSSTQHTGTSSWQTVRITMVVQAQGVEPFTLEHKCTARADRWPYAGMQLPVVFDREHHDRLDVKWDDVATGRERALEQADALRDALAAGGMAATPPAAGNVTVQTQVIDVSGDPAKRDALIDALEDATGQDLDGDGRVGKG